MSVLQAPVPTGEIPAMPPSVPASKIARNLAIHRERAGLTQSQLAEAATVSRATITLIESGHADPKISTLHLLAKALGLEVTDLID